MFRKRKKEYVLKGQRCFSVLISSLSMQVTLKQKGEGIN